MVSRESDADNYCRIFIIGARDCNPEDVRELFSNYGRITDVYFPIDKATRQKKGMHIASPRRQADTDKLETVQTRATKCLLVIHRQFSLARKIRIFTITFCKIQKIEMDLAIYLSVTR
jgi:RNA recognition motif. (a.k.a. RRM, RBD, or RNP domain)